MQSQLRKRKAFLVSRIGNLPQVDDWVVKARKKPKGSSKYWYKHPNIPGRFGGLTPAKEAHIAAIEAGQLGDSDSDVETDGSNTVVISDGGNSDSDSDSDSDTAVTVAEGRLDWQVIRADELARIRSDNSELKEKLKVLERLKEASERPVRAAREPVPTQVGLQPTAEHTLHAAGVEAAMAALELAFWRSARTRGAGIRKVYRGHFDVVLVDSSRFDPSELDALRKATKKGRFTDYNVAYLQSRFGFLLVKRSTVVIDSVTNEILALFVTGNEFPELAALGPKLPRLHRELFGKFFPILSRKGLGMVGYRFNRNGYTHTKRNMRTGYYCGKNKKLAEAMFKDEDMKALVVDVASEMCRIEMDVAPPMGMHRAAHARKSGHPGIYPGVPHSVCTAAALGYSEGYVSPIHSDEGLEDMTETIAWWSKDVKRDSDYAFGVFPAGVMFDLLAHDSVMCMVPCALEHGTLALNDGSRHKGVGVVIVNKANLVTPEAIADSAVLTERLNAGGRAKNHFRGNYSAKPVL